MAQESDPRHEITAGSAERGSCTVWIPSLLRDLTNGQETVAAQGNTVRQIIHSLDRAFPGIKDRLCAGNALRSGIAVAVNSQVSTLGLLQPVAPHSEIHFLHAVSGG